MATRRKQSPKLEPRFRVMSGRVIALGPGKAELLRHIAETGSITAAAGRMKMSYMRAWSLVQTMNHSFREPLVETTRGSTGGGGARLTPAGGAVLELYLELEASAIEAAQSSWRQLAPWLKT